eukprot:1300092-Amphidinium_carterae.1
MPQCDIYHGRIGQCNGCCMLLRRRRTCLRHSIECASLPSATSTVWRLRHRAPWPPYRMTACAEYCDGTSCWGASQDSEAKCSFSGAGRDSFSTVAFQQSHLFVLKVSIAGLIRTT